MPAAAKDRPGRDAKPRPVRIVPCLRYRDPAAAIDWLCVAFGFERHLIVSDEDGAIAHAELTLGEAMVIVPDADAHHEQAVAAGAEIEIEIKSEEHGGRGYTCRDIEGHIWNFGTYDPWAQPEPAPEAPAERRPARGEGGHSP